MAKRPRRRLVDKCVEGEERRKDGKEARVAKREEDDWGWKMWRCVNESETRDKISCSGNDTEEEEHIAEMCLRIT